MLVAGFGAISLGGRKWVRFPRTNAQVPETGEKVRRRLGSHLGRIMRPRTVGTYPQLVPLLARFRNMCILPTCYFGIGSWKIQSARDALNARLQIIRNSCAGLRRDCGPGCPALTGP